MVLNSLLLVVIPVLVLIAGIVVLFNRKHSALAALAAYPELGCTGGPYEVWRMWGISSQV